MSTAVNYRLWTHDLAQLGVRASPKLIHAVKVHAMKAGVWMQDFIAEAIREKLRKEKRP